MVDMERKIFRTPGHSDNSGNAKRRERAMRIPDALIMSRAASRQLHIADELVM
jgi:hypothetical protein